MKCKFKKGTTLQDLINTNPCWEDFRDILNTVHAGEVNPKIPLDTDLWNEAINSNPDWLEYCDLHLLMERQTLSFKIEVDGEVVWEGDGNQLHIAENDWWVLELTKDGYRCLNYVHGSLRGTNIANDGHFICKSWAFDYLNDDYQLEEEYEDHCNRELRRNGFSVG